MIPRKYSSSGFVIRRRNYSEADRLITLFTRDYGKVTFIAKGVRRPKSRKRGHVEMFSLVNFSANKTKSIDVLSEVESKESFELNNDMRKISVAYFIMESIDKLTHEGEKNEQLYLLLHRNMRELQNTTHLKTFRHKFIRDILVLMGYFLDGKDMPNPDSLLEEITEKRMNSARVGKKII